MLYCRTAESGRAKVEIPSGSGSSPRAIPTPLYTSRQPYPNNPPTHPSHFHTHPLFCVRHSFPPNTHALTSMHLISTPVLRNLIVRRHARTALILIYIQARVQFHALRTVQRVRSSGMHTLPAVRVEWVISYARLRVLRSGYD